MHKGHGDRLRREALLRSRMTCHLAGVGPCSETRQGPYLLSKTMHRVKSPTGPSAEIDVEYGTDTDEPQVFDPGEMVSEQMTSEWWVEGGSHYSRHLPVRCRPQAELAPGDRSWVCFMSSHLSWPHHPFWIWLKPFAPKSDELVLTHLNTFCLRAGSWFSRSLFFMDCARTQRACALHVSDIVTAICDSSRHTSSDFTFAKGLSPSVCVP